jgi:hypothetical protein
MNRYTTDKPKTMVDTMLNIAYAKDHEVYIRGYGPNGKDISLIEYCVPLYEKEIGPLNGSMRNTEDFGELMDGDGWLDLFYWMAVGYVENRARLAEYEDSGLMPEEAAHLASRLKSNDKFEETLMKDGYQLTVEIERLNEELHEVENRYVKLHGIWKMPQTGKVHRLKTVQPYYDASAYGRKSFEIRKDDRGFSEGDILWLYEWDGKNQTGREHFKQVTYILRDQPYVPVGFVCMAVQLIDRSLVENSRR